MWMRSFAKDECDRPDRWYTVQPQTKSQHDWLNLSGDRKTGHIYLCHIFVIKWCQIVYCKNSSRYARDKDPNSILSGGTMTSMTRLDLPRQIRLWDCDRICDRRSAANIFLSGGNGVVSIMFRFQEFTGLDEEPQTSLFSMLGQHRVRL